MKRFRVYVVLLLAVLAGVPSALAAQAPPQPPSGDVAPQAPQDAAAAPADTRSRSRGVVRIGSDFTLGANDRVREMVVIAGGGTIEGHVDRDVVVVFGQARVAGTALIEGSLVVVGGGVTVAPGAVVRRDFVVVGGVLEGPSDFTVGGDHVVVGPALSGYVSGLVGWITGGLLWGRPIAPSLPWVWTIVGVFFLVYLLLNLLCERPIHAAAERLTARSSSESWCSCLSDLCRFFWPSPWSDSWSCRSCSERSWQPGLSGGLRPPDGLAWRSCESRRRPAAGRRCGPSSSASR